MKFDLKYLLTALILLIFTINGFTQAHYTHFDHSKERDSKNIFLKIMDTMMIDMMHVSTAKSAEEDFFLQMTAHHRGAIEMAQYEIANGKNFEMIQLAKSILAEQQIELLQMPVWIKQLSLKDNHLIPPYYRAMDKIMSVMMINLPKNDSLSNIDIAFVRVMLPHHQAAVDMAKVILNYGEDSQTLAFAKMLISNEQIEIQQMSLYIQKL